MRQNYDEVVVECERLILQGRSATAIDRLAGLPAHNRSTWLALGDAHRAAGNFPSALAAYSRFDTSDKGSLDPDLAWRMGLAYQQQGAPRRALEVYGRAPPSQGEPIDQAWLLCCAATAHWLLGDAQTGLTCARAAGDLAMSVGESRVLAAAHIAMALVVSLGGDPATVGEEYAQAAIHAAAAGDLVQIARIDVNLSHHLLADARFAEAVDIAARAGAAAERLGSATLLAVALDNEAEGLIRLGRLDDALARCERALALAGAIGTHRTAGALLVLAQVHVRRGSREQARAALEQALRLTSTHNDRQVRVPALACLATTLLPDDVDLASSLAAEALEAATGSSTIPALLAAGLTARARHDAETASTLATQAVEHARRRRERTWLAEALELRAATLDRTRGRAALQEAHRIWDESGATHDGDRVLVQLSRLTAHPSTADRLAARLALARLHAAGVSGAAQLGLEQGRIPVQIRTFGRFEVYVDGIAVPPEAWQSRQARGLLRLLTCRRGRAIPRMEICELLWPDDDPDRTTHRLSVVLSVLRGVVGQEAVAADQACVALNSACVEVDVEQFLLDVADAVALQERGSATDARLVLIEAVHSYTDEPFADAPYDDETIAVRDEARAAYHQALRLLAEYCRTAGEHDRAAAYLRRLLEDDRYDEDAHRALLAILVHARRHGQARAAAAQYRAAMADLGLPADSEPRGAR